MSVNYHDITERKKLEAENNRLAAIVQYAEDAIIGKDLEGNIVSWNRGAETIYGYKASELKGKSLSLLMVPGDYSEEYKELLKRSLTGELIKNYETKRKRKDGKIIDVSLTISPIKDSSGKFIGDSVIARDITERKQAEEILRKNEEELSKLNRTLKALSDSSQAMMYANNEKDYLNETCKIIVKDCGYIMAWIGFAEQDEAKTVRPVAQAGFEEGYLQTVNITWSDSELGRGPTGTSMRIGKPVICNNMLTDPDFKPWRKQAVKRGYASSIAIPFNNVNTISGAVMIYSKDPDPFREKEVQLLFKLVDNIGYGIMAIRLHAERAKSEESLRESQYLLRLVLDSIPIRIFWKDINLNYLGCNQKFASDTGLESSELCIGRSDFDMNWTREQAISYRVDDNEVISSNIPKFNYEEPITTPEGKMNWVRSSKIPLLDTNGKIKGILGTYEDITERKEIENKLEKANEILKELSVDLANASRAKSEFIANMSHELRTPLNSINGFSEVLYDETFGPLNEKQKQYISNVLSSGKHLLLLINQVLDMSKVEAGKMQLKLSSIPMKKLLTEIVALESDKISKANLQIQLEIDEDLPDIKADELKVKEITYNLLSNAIKFTPKNGKIGMRAKKAGTNIVIEVWDTGIGIAPENLKKIFEGFFRVESPYCRETEGTGLGLSLSKKLTELHNGTLIIESEGLNKGTIVKISLPII